MRSNFFRKNTLLFSALASLALVCGTGCANDDPKSSTDAMTQAPAETVYVDETGDGMTFEVVKGQDVVLNLPGNPTTGNTWTVASTTRSFGYPQSEDYQADGDQVGGGGVFEFLWVTDGFLPMEGSHTVVMHYAASPDEEPIDTFTFTVDLIAADQQGPVPLIIDESGNETTVDVVAGTEVLVLLGGNPTAGCEWVVTVTDRTFGYPQSEHFAPDGDAVGGGGTFEFVWVTESFMPMEGAHTVVLEYQCTSESEPADTFTFTVNILGAQPEN